MMTNRQIVFAYIIRDSMVIPAVAIWQHLEWSCIASLTLGPASFLPPVWGSWGNRSPVTNSQTAMGTTK